MLKKEQQGYYLKSLKQYDLFEAQLQLESEIYSSLAGKLLSLPLDEAKLSLEYAKVRGGLEALQQIESVRTALIAAVPEKST